MCIPEYAKLVAPLLRLLGVAAKATVGTRRKSTQERVHLVNMGDDVSCFEAIKDTLRRMVLLAHPTSDK
ncbi:hypothetical protein H310_15349, partial [Aphanomyces invadans]